MKLWSAFNTIFWQFNRPKIDNENNLQLQAFVGLSCEVHRWWTHALFEPWRSRNDLWSIKATCQDGTNSIQPFNLQKKQESSLTILTADFQLSPVWLLPVGCLLAGHNCVHPPGIRRVIFFLGHSYNTGEIILNLDVIHEQNKIKIKKDLPICQQLHINVAVIVWN